MRKSAVVIRDLRVVRGGRPIIDGLDLDVPAGSVEVLDAAAGSPSLRRRVGYQTQDASVYSDLTVAQNLRYFASLSGVPSPAKAVAAAVATVDLGGHEKQRVVTLSGGERSRVSLAAALVGDPELLVLDEPTVGLDPVLRRDLWAVFRRLAADGRTLLVSSHVMDEAMQCDRLLLMRAGGLVADTTPDELLASTGAPDAERAFLALIDAAQARAEAGAADAGTQPTEETAR